MDDVSTEIGLGVSANMNNFYTVSLGGGLGLGMYHNLAMGPGNNLTYKTAIYDPRSLGASGENLKLGNFYNYSQTPNIRLSWNITNNNADNNVNVTIYLYDSATTTYRPITPPAPPGLNLNAGGGNSTETDYDTGVAADPTNFANGVYQIAFDTSAMYIGPPPPPGAGVSGNTISASDTDGVGAGIVRNTTTPANFDQFNPIFNAPYVRGNIPGGTGDGIFVNKRTTFSITFN